MQLAIITMRLEATVKLGVRYSAKTVTGLRITLRADPRLTEDDNHRRAAQELRQRLGWQDRLVPGVLLDGSTVAWVPDPAGSQARRTLEAVAACVPDAQGGVTLGSHELGLVEAARLAMTEKRLPGASR